MSFGLILTLIFQIRALLAAFRHAAPQPLPMKLTRLLDGPLPVLRYLVGGILLFFDTATGLMFIAIGTMLAPIANGWVLLIEIRR